MSELDLILNALATGAAATASQAVQDAYQELKARLRALFDGRPEAQGKMDANPADARRWAELIGADLVEYGAATDTEVDLDGRGGLRIGHLRRPRQLVQRLEERGLQLVRRGHRRRRHSAVA